MSLCGVQGSELIGARAMKNCIYGVVLCSLMLLRLSRQANRLRLVCDVNYGVFCALIIRSMFFCKSLSLLLFVLENPEVYIVLTVGTSYFQVFDLSVVKPSDFIKYGLGCLERLADQGDHCAKEIRGKLRIMVGASYALIRILHLLEAFKSSVHVLFFICC